MFIGLGTAVRLQAPTRHPPHPVQGSRFNVRGSRFLLLLVLGPVPPPLPRSADIHGYPRQNKLQNGVRGALPSATCNLQLSTFNPVALPFVCHHSSAPPPGFPDQSEPNRGK